MDVPGAARAVKLSRRLRRGACLGVGQARERARKIGDLDVDSDGQRLRHRVDQRGAASLDPVETCQLDRRVDDECQQRHAGDTGETEQHERGAPAATRPVCEPGEGHSGLCPPRVRPAGVDGRSFPIAVRERGETFSLRDRRRARQTRVAAGRMRRGTAVALCVGITNIGRQRC